jgi:hypothetical protein
MRPNHEVGQETIDGSLIVSRPHFVSSLVIEVWTRKCDRLTLPRAASTLQNCRVERNADASPKHPKKFSFLRPHLASTPQLPFGGPSWFTNNERDLVLNRVNNRTLRGALGDRRIIMRNPQRCMRLRAARSTSSPAKAARHNSSAAASFAPP